MNENKTTKEKDFNPEWERNITNHSGQNIYLLIITGLLIATLFFTYRTYQNSCKNWGSLEHYDSLYTEKLLTNNNTIKYSMLDNSSNLTIYSKNKEETISYFKSNGIYIIDTYEKEKSDYINMKRESMTTSIIIASIVLLISLVEIYLIIRASFLSRIKEVGILRAIGVKKIDIYKMFLGEIIDITLMMSVPGFIFMNYILKSLIDSNVLTLNFNINSFTMIASLILIVLFNTLFGLLPVFGVIRKTPQSILSRIDVD